MLVESELLLLIYFTTLSFMSAILPTVLKPLWMCLCGQSSDEKSIFNEIHMIKAEQQHISMKDNFAAHAKLQRRVIRLEEAQREAAQARLSKSLQLKLIITYGMQAIIGVVMVGSSLWYRSVPLLVLDQSLFPLENFFSYPSGVPNAITPHAWVIISRISMSSLLKAI